MLLGFTFGHLEKIKAKKIGLPLKWWWNHGVIYHDGTIIRLKITHKKHTHLQIIQGTLLSSPTNRPTFRFNWASRAMHKRYPESRRNLEVFFSKKKSDLVGGFNLATYTYWLIRTLQKTYLLVSVPSILTFKISSWWFFTNPFCKNMRKSNWVKIFPQVSGWTFQKYMSCHHLVTTSWAQIVTNDK